jgi:predicted nuclease of restriction endonuclease-like RecB superfamily
LLQHRLHPARRVLVELAGFWTPEYLGQKFARLAEANAANLIVCVDAERACGVEANHGSLCILPYRGHVDANALMARVAQLR